MKKGSRRGKGEFRLGWRLRFRLHEECVDEEGFKERESRSHMWRVQPGLEIRVWVYMKNV